jgi:hypothetical protein
MDERRECGEPHARALARLGGAGRRARAHDMRVNGPPKSAPPPLAGARLPFAVWFFGCLTVTFILTDRYKISTDREIFVGG